MPGHRLSLLALLLGLVLLQLAPAASGPPQQPPQAQGAFRSRVTLVPVDVRVLDRDGRPVTDLSQEYFTVLENSVRQEIRHFSRQRFGVEAAATDAGPLPEASPIELAPQNHRIFLILLGRGRLQHPGRNLDALIRFVRERLLPSDQVAVFAYNRATDFTTDHEKMARVIERFKRGHDAIEAELGHHFGGLAAMFRGPEIPASTQSRIDAVFRSVAAGFWEVPSGRVTDADRIRDDTRRAADALDRRDILRDREGIAPEDTNEGDEFDVSFGVFAATSVRAMHDLGNLYTGIEYLRHVEGEKHLVFVTERGLSLPRVEDDRNIAALANDARVVIDTIYTGGMVGAPPPTRSGTSPVPSATAVFNQTFRVGTARTMAELTGGHASAFRPADAALTRIDQSTRFSYLLGYYPSPASWDGRYRRIAVKVSRPGVTVLFRHGYYAQPDVVPSVRRKPVGGSF